MVMGNGTYLFEIKLSRVTVPTAKFVGLRSRFLNVISLLGAMHPLPGTLYQRKAIFSTPSTTFDCCMRLNLQKLSARRNGSVGLATPRMDSLNRLRSMRSTMIPSTKARKSLRTRCAHADPDQTRYCCFAGLIRVFAFAWVCNDLLLVR